MLDISKFSFTKDALNVSNNLTKTLSEFAYYTKVIFKEIKFTENHFDQVN